MNNIEIIDAHHHIWLRERTPWLQGPIVPRIFGDYAEIRRDYLIEEFAAEAWPQGVAGSVYVQVNVAPGDEVWEAEWALEQGARVGMVDAVVAYCDLADARASDLLDRLCAIGAVRGIRQQMHWHENVLYRFQPQPARFLDAEWQNGLRALARRKLHFELQVFPEQAEAALRLIDAFPNLPFTLLHAGMPWEETPEGRARWLAGLRAFARRDNVVTKLSAFGTFDRRCDAERWRGRIQPTVDIFGPERCIWGSNYPIEKLWTSYADLMQAVRTALSIYTPGEQRAILGGNARALYGIAPKLTPASAPLSVPA